MAFGVHLAQAASLDLKARHEEAVRGEAVRDDAPADAAAPQAAVAAPAPSRFPGRRPPAPPVGLAGRRSPTGPAPGVPALPSSFRPGMPMVSSGAVRTDTLIEEVVRFRMLKMAEAVALQKEARSDPLGTRQRLEKIYTEEILPARRSGLAAFADKRQAEPDKVHALFVRGLVHRTKSWPRAEAEETGYSLLDGATVDTVPASRTPFPPPSVFAAAAAAKEVEVADAAFDEAPSSETTARPRP